MKLANFLSINGMSRAEFGKRILVHEDTVTRYLNKTRTPSPDVLSRIAKATAGAVTPNDFLLPDPQPREAAE
jgi:transcriptional regulator with XRE-family HTH domain